MTSILVSATSRKGGVELMDASEQDFLLLFGLASCFVITVSEKIRNVRQNQIYLALDLWVVVVWHFGV